MRRKLGPKTRHLVQNTIALEMFPITMVGKLLVGLYVVVKD